MRCIAAIVAAANLPAAFAQGYPLKPVRFVSPFPAAGINDIIARIVRTPEVGRQFTVQGVEAAATTPAEYAGIISTDLANWGTMIRDTGIRGE